MRMSLDHVMRLSSGWPVLLGAGLMLGCITVWSTEWRAHLVGFLPVLLLAAMAFVFVTGGAGRVLILALEQLGIGVVALFRGVVLSFLVVWSFSISRHQTGYSSEPRQSLVWPAHHWPTMSRVSRCVS